MKDKKKYARAKAEQYKQEVKSKAVGPYNELVCWSSRSDQLHTHSKVVKALTDVGLAASMAPEILPKSAFTRACNVMEEARSIDKVKDDPPNITFQFTAEFLDKKGEEMHFKKEGKVVLNIDTGKVSSPVQGLADMAQKELDRHMELRTTADITRIVQKFFETQTDLIPLREQGCVYLILKTHTHLIDPMEKFLDALGGRLTRIPILEGTIKGDKSVAASIEEYLKYLVVEHKKSAEKFNVGTRNDTIAGAIESYKTTKLKIAAMRHLLGSEVKNLDQFLAKTDVQIAKAFNAITKEKESKPEKKPGEKRDTVLGFKVTDIIRWMRVKGWSKPEANAVLKEYGIVVSVNTINTQYSRAIAWKGKKGGEIPKLSKAQEKELMNNYEKVKGE